MIAPADLAAAIRWAQSPDADITLAADQFRHVLTLASTVDALTQALAHSTVQLTEAQEKLEIHETRVHEKLSAQETDHPRLWDLVRYCRGYLSDEQLISLEEYADLASGRDQSKAARRLEDYDALQSKLAAAEAHVADLARQLQSETACDFCGLRWHGTEHHNWMECPGCIALQEGARIQDLQRQVESLTAQLAQAKDEQGKASLFIRQILEAVGERGQDRSSEQYPVGSRVQLDALALAVVGEIESLKVQLDAAEVALRRVVAFHILCPSGQEHETGWPLADLSQSLDDAVGSQRRYICRGCETEFVLECSSPSSGPQEPK